jgi:hypothetical protein
MKTTNTAAPEEFASRSSEFALGRTLAESRRQRLVRASGKQACADLHVRSHESPNAVSAKQIRDYRMVFEQP